MLARLRERQGDACSSSLACWHEAATMLDRDSCCSSSEPGDDVASSCSSDALCRWQEERELEIERERVRALEADLTASMQSGTTCSIDSPILPQPSRYMSVYEWNPR